MCEQCSAETVAYNFPIDSFPFILVRATRDGDKMLNGDWGLLECNDPSFIFTGDVLAVPDLSLVDLVNWFGFAGDANRPSLEFSAAAEKWNRSVRHGGFPKNIDMVSDANRLYEAFRRHCQTVLPDNLFTEVDLMPESGLAVVSPFSRAFPYVLYWFVCAAVAAGIVQPVDPPEEML